VPHGPAVSALHVSLHAITTAGSAVGPLEQPLDPHAASASMANAPNQVPTFVLFIVYVS
jgi:hypothetical protein